MVHSIFFSHYMFIQLAIVFVFLYEVLLGREVLLLVPVCMCSFPMTLSPTNKRFAFKFNEKRVYLCVLRCFYSNPSV